MTLSWHIANNDARGLDENSWRIANRVGVKACFPGLSGGISLSALQVKSAGFQQGRDDGERLLTLFRGGVAQQLVNAGLGRIAEQIARFKLQSFL